MVRSGASITVELSLAVEITKPGSSYVNLTVFLLQDLLASLIDSDLERCGLGALCPGLGGKT